MLRILPDGSLGRDRHQEKISFFSTKILLMFLKDVVTKEECAEILRSVYDRYPVMNVIDNSDGKYTPLPSDWLDDPEYNQTYAEYDKKQEEIDNKILEWSNEDCDEIIRKCLG